MFESPPVAADALCANTHVALPRDVTASQRTEPTLLSGASATRPGEGIAVSPEPVVVAIAQIAHGRLQFAALDPARRPFGSVLPPRLVAALAKVRHYRPVLVSPDATLARDRPTAGFGTASFNSFGHVRSLP
jgi:hypothetical protein